LVSFED
jgi:Permuted papain-like amidase enzyme, YaeF/YiiX, C92 family